ncbi:MAG: hypothetical protein K6A14_03770 [Erysipelotrichaceae bacterium]|nr:hypothetical protein [Erysipelotrichaceae bacterium]
MEKYYTINDLAMMSGFTTRTLRTYLTADILHGQKENGAWKFSEKDVYEFFADPYVKEGLRIKNSAVVFDFLADRSKKTKRSCVVLDIPASMEEGRRLSDFFCGQMEKVCDTQFKLDWDDGCCRIILSGAEDQIAVIMKEYYKNI